MGNMTTRENQIKELLKTVVRNAESCHIPRDAQFVEVPPTVQPISRTDGLYKKEGNRA